METPLEKSARLVLNTYDKYSEKSENKSVMKNKHLKELIQNEINVQPIKEEEDYQRVIAELEINGDMEVNLDKFLSLVARVLVSKNKDK